MSTIPDVVSPRSGRTSGNPESYPGIVRFFAYLFSYVFHPLFIPVYVAAYLVFLHPYYFNGLDSRGKIFILLRVINNMVFFPAVTVFLLKGIGFINSIFLKTQRERIIPYIASGIFFFWMYLVCRNQEEIAPILTSFVFSVFLSSSAALIANIYFKISMHAIGVGGLLGLVLIMLATNPSTPVTVPFVCSLLITGIVCTARMIVGDHTQKDIYAGVACGLLCQLAGAWFIL